MRYRYSTELVRAVRGSRLQGLLALCLLSAIGLSLAQVVDASANESAIPVQIAGEWRVKSVLVDLASGRRTEYQRDDPRLLHHTFRFKPTSIVDDAPEARECATPRFWHTSLRLSELVGLTFAARGEPSTPPGPHDFDLPVSGDPVVDVFSVQCESGRFGPRALKAARKTLGGDAIGTWVVELPAGRLAIRWFDETILVLDRVTR